MKKILYTLCVLQFLFACSLNAAPLKLAQGGLLKFGKTSYENWVDPLALTTLHFGEEPGNTHARNSATEFFNFPLFDIIGAGEHSYAKKSFLAPLIGSATYKTWRIAGASVSPHVGLPNRDMPYTDHFSAKVYFRIGRLPNYSPNSWGKIWFYNFYYSESVHTQLTFIRECDASGTYTNQVYLDHGDYEHMFNFTPVIGRWYSFRIWTVPASNGNGVDFHFECPEASYSFVDPSVTISSPWDENMSPGPCLYEQTSDSNSDSFLPEFDEFHLSLTGEEPPLAPVEFSRKPGAILRLGE